MSDSLRRLKELYANSSKHSQYQRLPTCLEEILDLRNTEMGSKYEKERFKYICENTNLGETVIDIGGNTGFFTFESIFAGVRKVDYWEGNDNHAQFVQLASDIVGCENSIDVHNEYFVVSRGDDRCYDTILFLNVLHHLGVDFSEENSINKAKLRMLDYLNGLAKYGKKMVFQMGFNWGGDINKPLFEHGLKEEMITYISNGTKGKWSIEKIGIAVKKDKDVIYENMTAENINRIDEYGEFLNRPIFIMNSKEF